MPMVELTTTRGALRDAAKQQLAVELSIIALELEAAPFADFSEDEHMQALSWCFVNEQEVYVGGEVSAKPIYRVTVTIPEGAPGLLGPLAKRGHQRRVERVTEAVLGAEGSECTIVEAHRVWVHLRVIADGHWMEFGQVVTLPDLAAYGLQSDEPGRQDRAHARGRLAIGRSDGAQEPVDVIPLLRPGAVRTSAGTGGR